MWEQDIRKPAENSGSNGVSIAFVLDRSKSMDWNDEDNLRNKLTTQFVEKLSEDTDKGSIVSFIADAKVVAKLTNNKAALKNAVDSIVNDSGYNSNSGTNGSAGIYTGIQELKGDASGNSRYIFFMTDGEDNRYSYEYSDLINMANENEITIYTIGLGDVDSSVLEKVANETGGKYYYAPSADELSEGYKKPSRKLSTTIPTAMTTVSPITTQSSSAKESSQQVQARESTHSRAYHTMMFRQITITTATTLRTATNLLSAKTTERYTAMLYPIPRRKIQIRTVSLITRTQHQELKDLQAVLSAN